MKRALAKTVMCVVVATMALIILNNAAWSSQEKPIELLFGFFEPPQGPYAKAMKVWAKEVEEKTEGRIVIKLSLGGALGKPGEFYDLAVKGICDMAACVPAFGGPGRFPMAEIIGLPYVMPTGEISSQALMAFAKKGYVDKEFADVKLLHVMSGHGDILYTKDKPVTTLADVKGLKLAAATPPVQHRVKLMGGIPVAIPFTDQYSALQKGIIDGILLNWQVMETFKLSEVLHYATLPSMGGVMCALVMNKNTWNRLPSDVQALIDGMSDRYAVEFGRSWDAVCDIGKKAFFRDGGRILEWKPEDLPEVNKRLAPLWEGWIAAKEEKGLPARKAVDDLYNILKDLGVDPPAVGYTPGK